jgi:hypothetical protein
MTDDFLRDDDDKEFDPADLKKKSVFDLLEDDELLVDDLKFAGDVVEDDEEESFALYQADDDSTEQYSY